MVLRIEWTYSVTDSRVVGCQEGYADRRMRAAALEALVAQLESAPDPAKVVALGRWLLVDSDDRLSPLRGEQDVFYEPGVHVRLCLVPERGIDGGA